MEYEISIEEMSLDEIANKIRALRSNEEIENISLVVKRKGEASKLKKSEKSTMSISVKENSGEF